MSQPKEYVLGTGNDELARLALHHRVWADVAAAAWKRAGVGPGSKVLDLGCGPGYASFDLSQLVTSSGDICAVDESQSFLNYLSTQARAQGLNQIRTQLGDAQKLSESFPSGEKFDAIYIRWVLTWLPYPEKALNEIRKMLKPGGKVIIHDYFNWKAMTIAPRSPGVDAMIKAAVESFIENKGDPDIAARLPAMLRESGFELKHFDSFSRVARGGGRDSTVHWVLNWWRTYGPKLVQQGRLSESDFALAMKDLDSLEKNEDQFFYCPPVFEFIAESK